MASSRVAGALATLPPTTDPATELDWISSHPIMMRSASLNDQQRTRISIGLREILTCPHGPAPSRRAVNQLTMWVKDPKKFHDKLLGEQQKSAAAKATKATGGIDDVGIEEMKEYLRRISGD